MSELTRAITRLSNLVDTSLSDWEDVVAKAEELGTKLEVYEYALNAIAKEEETLGWVYAARIAKVALAQVERDAPYTPECYTEVSDKDYPPVRGDSD